MATDDRRPLTETIFYVLLALGAPLHGYGIMQRVNELTAGRVALVPARCTAPSPT